MKRKLVLENHRVFYGEGFGSPEKKIAEIVFNTSMVGYQEILSDPSYCDQIVVMTYPLIGNYGLADEDYESKGVFQSGFVVREYNDSPSNFRYTETLSEKMEECHSAGIEGVDTREIVRIIRDYGSMKAMIVDADVPDEECFKELEEYKYPHDQVSRVSSKKVWYSRCADPAYNVVAIDCGCKKVKLNVSASREHNLKNLNMTPEESVAGFAECVSAADAAGIAVSGSISMPFGSPWDGKIPQEQIDAIIEAYLNVGIREISLSDTSGMAVPAQVYEICSHVREKYPEATWWLHFHNTRGNALANILSAMQAGMTQFDSSFGGLGGCPFVPNAAGNVSSEDVVNMCEESGVETGIDVRKLMAASRSLLQYLGKDGESYILRAGLSSDLIEKMKAD